MRSREDVDIEAEKQLLARLRRALRVDQSTKDADAFMNVIAEDALMIPPNRPPVRGSKAIREAVVEVIKRPAISISGQITGMEVSAAGDLAHIIGFYRLVVEGPEGPIESEGNSITLWKKIEGQWKCVVKSWSKIRAKEMK